MPVAQLRGAKFRDNRFKEKTLVPIDFDHYTIASQAMRDVAEWLGLSTSYQNEKTLSYLDVLEAEREKIFDRAKD